MTQGTRTVDKRKKGGSLLLRQLGNGAKPERREAFTSNKVAKKSQTEGGGVVDKM